MVKNMTALMIAAWQGNIKIVNDLIAAGADVNARLSDGSTALILATEQEHSECVDILIKAGADVNITADINLPNLHCIKTIQNQGGNENQMGIISKQLGPNHNAVDDLPVRNEDKTSNNGGIQAAFPNPVPRIVTKPDEQKIHKQNRDDNNNDKNERNVDDQSNASSVHRADKSYHPGHRRKCNPTNHRKDPSPENRVGCSVGEDVSSGGVDPPLVPAGESGAIGTATTIAPAIRKSITIIPEVGKSLSIPLPLRKARTLPPDVGKCSAVVETPVGTKRNNRTVRNASAIGNSSTAFQTTARTLALAQYPVIPAVGNASTMAPMIGNFPTAFQATGQTPVVAQYPVVPTVGSASTVAPMVGNFSTALQVTGQTPVGAQYPVIPAVGNPAIVAPAIGNLSTAPGKNPTLTQHPMVSTMGNAPRKGPALEKHPTAAISQATAKSSTMGQPIKVFLKIASAEGRTQSVYQVLSPGEFREVPPAAGKNPSGVLTGKTAAVGKVPETIPAPVVVTSCEKSPVVVSLQAPSVFPSVRKDAAVVSSEGPAAFPKEETEAAVDAVTWKNSSGKESPRTSPHDGDSGNGHRRKRSHSPSSDSGGDDSLVHKKQRTASPVKVKQEPSESDDKASHDENEGTSAITAAAVKHSDDSDDDDGGDADWFFERMNQAPTESTKQIDSNDTFGDYSGIKQEPTGRDENEGTVNKPDDDHNNNDGPDSILPTSRYPPSPTFSWSPPPFPSTSTSFSLSPQANHGGESSSDKSRRHHHKRHHRHPDDSTGEHSSSHKKKKKKSKKKHRASSPEKQENRGWFPVTVKQEPAW